MKTILAIALITGTMGVSLVPTASQAAIAAAAVGGGPAPGGPAPGGPSNASGGPSSHGYEGQANVNLCVPHHRKIATGKLLFDRCWSR